MNSCARCATVCDTSVRYCPRDGTSISAREAVPPDGGTRIVTLPAAASRRPACHLVLREIPTGVLHDLDLLDAPTLLGRGAASMYDPRLFADDTVSARHASVRNDRGEVVLEDSNSRNGTFVNGVPTRGAKLKVGDRITLGTLDVAVDAIVFDAELPTVVIETLRGGEPGRRSTFRKAVITFGRAPTNDVVIDDRHGYVSRQHAELTVTAAGLTVRDLGSSNGTFVNGAPVRTTLLHSGATIEFPPSSFAYRVLLSDDVARCAPPRPVAAAADTRQLHQEAEDMMSFLRACLQGWAVNNPVWLGFGDFRTNLDAIAATTDRREVADRLRAALDSVDLERLVAGLDAHVGALTAAFVDGLAGFGRALGGLVPELHPAMAAVRGRAASVTATADRIAQRLRREYATFDAVAPELWRLRASYPRCREILCRNEPVDPATGGERRDPSDRQLLAEVDAATQRVRAAVDRASEAAAAVIAPLLEQTISDFLLVYHDGLDAALQLGADPARIHGAYSSSSPSRDRPLASFYELILDQMRREGLTAAAERNIRGVIGLP